MSLRPLPRPEAPGFASRLRSIRQDDALLSCHLRNMANLQRRGAYELGLLRASRETAEERAR